MKDIETRCSSRVHKAGQGRAKLANYRLADPNTLAPFRHCAFTGSDMYHVLLGDTEMHGNNMLCEAGKLTVSNATKGSRA